MYLSKKIKIISLVLIVLLLFMFSGIAVLNHYYKPQAANLTPAPTAVKWFYNKKTETIETKKGDTTFIFKTSTGTSGKLCYLLYNPDPEGISTSVQEVCLEKKAELFRLSGSIPVEKRMSLLVIPSETGNIYGKIARIGTLFAGSLEEAKREVARNNTSIFFLKKEKNSRSFFMPITQEIADSMPSPYKNLYSQYVSANGKFDIEVSYLSDPNIDSYVRVTPQMAENCQNKLPDNPIDLNNPPADVKQIFDTWNETYAKNENSTNKVPVANFDQENNSLFRNIIPKDPAEPVAESSLRRNTISEVLDQLGSAVQQMWNKTDIETVSEQQIKGCLVGAIVAGLAAGPWAAAGGGIACGLGASAINKIARAIIGTNLPEAFTRAAIALYYEAKLYDYLDCLQKQESYQDLPKDLRDKIEREKNRIEGETSALTTGLQEGYDQFGSGNDFFHKILDYVSNTIRNLLSSLLRITWGVIASAPL